jgi:hypothetical protein
VPATSGSTWTVLPCTATLSSLTGPMRLSYWRRLRHGIIPETFPGSRQADVLDNRIDLESAGLVYESCSAADKGPSAETFVLTLRYGELPLLNGNAIDLDGYDMLDSPYLNSLWDSSVVKLRFGSYRLTIDVANP